MSDCILDPGESKLAKAAPAKPRRYESSKSQKFRDLCHEASQGDKYDLSEEIGVIRGQMSRIVKALEPDEDTLKTNGLFGRLVEDERFSKSEAAYIVRAVEGAGKSKEIETIAKALRETLKQAAEFEGMIPILKVREWARAFMRIVREEVKDDSIIERIRTRAGSEPV